MVVREIGIVPSGVKCKGGELGGGRGKCRRRKRSPWKKSLFRKRNFSHGLESLLHTSARLSYQNCHKLHFALLVVYITSTIRSVELYLGIQLRFL